MGTSLVKTPDPVQVAPPAQPAGFGKGKGFGGRR